MPSHTARRTTTVFAAAVLGLGAAVAGAAPAQAWPGSPTVTVSGTLVQCSRNGIQSADVNAVLNGERHILRTAAAQPPSYTVVFGNVPPSGGWAWIVVACRVTGSPQGHWVRVYRPVVGSTVRADL
jgi:hypothetical protein